MDLSWDAPNECPTAAEIRADVTRIVGPKERRHVSVRAQARQDDRTWTLELHTRAGDDEGERTLQGASCLEVARAAVVVIALTIDPNVLSAPPLPPAPPQPPPLPPPQPRRVFAVVRMSGGASFATPPGAAPYVSLAGGVRAMRFAAHAGAGFAFETSETTAALPSAGGAFWLFLVFGRVCGAPLMLGRFEGWGCAGLEVDRFTARGFGVTSPTNTDVWWAAPRADVELAWALLPTLRLIFPIEAAFPLDRPTFKLDGVGPVFQPAPILVRASFGAELLF